MPINAEQANNLNIKDVQIIDKTNNSQKLSVGDIITCFNSYTDQKTNILIAKLDTNTTKFYSPIALNNTSYAYAGSDDIKNLKGYGYKSINYLEQDLHNVFRYVEKQSYVTTTIKNKIIKPTQIIYYEPYYNAETIRVRKTKKQEKVIFYDLDKNTKEQFQIGDVITVWNNKDKKEKANLLLAKVHDVDYLNEPNFIEIALNDSKYGSIGTDPVYNGMYAKYVDNFGRIVYNLKNNFDHVEKQNYLKILAYKPQSKHKTCKKLLKDLITLKA